MESETTQVSNIRPKYEPMKRGRPMVSNRYDPETGLYDHKPSDPEYFKMYYRNKLMGLKIECPCCHKMVSKAKISRHVQTQKCVKCKPSLNSLD